MIENIIVEILDLASFLSDLTYLNGNMRDHRKVDQSGMFDGGYTYLQNKLDCVSFSLTSHIESKQT